MAPDGNYLLVAHSRGTTSFRTFCNFCTDSTGFSCLFPGLRPWLGMMNGIFYIPTATTLRAAVGLQLGGKWQTNPMSIKGAPSHHLEQEPDLSSGRAHSGL